LHARSAPVLCRGSLVQGLEFQVRTVLLAVGRVEPQQDHGLHLRAGDREQLPHVGRVDQLHAPFLPLEAQDPLGRLDEVLTELQGDLEEVGFERVVEDRADHLNELRQGERAEPLGGLPAERGEVGSCQVGDVPLPAERGDERFARLVVFGPHDPRQLAGIDLGPLCVQEGVDHVGQADGICLGPANLPVQDVVHSSR
jgi:hypothetical protein